MSFYGGSRLPFARLQNSPKLPKRFPAAPRRHSGRGEPFLQLQQVPEAVAMSFYGVQGCHLPTPGITQAAAYPSFSFDEPLRPWHCLFTGVQSCLCQPSKLAHASLRVAFLHAELLLESLMALISFLFSLSFSRERATASCDMVFPMACHA